MKAHETRRGGRHVARERGAEDAPENEPVALPEVPKSSRLIDRLDGESLLSIMMFCGLSAAEFEERYGS